MRSYFLSETGLFKTGIAGSPKFKNIAGALMDATQTSMDKSINTLSKILNKEGAKKYSKKELDNIQKLYAEANGLYNKGFETFNTEENNGVLSVTFDYSPVNIQGLPMIADLNVLAQKLESDSNVKVVVFQSAHPEIFIAHADTNFLKDMSDKAVSREEVQLLDLQLVLELSLIHI